MRIAPALPALAAAIQLAGAQFAVAPPHPLMDERVRIVISGLPPNQPIVVRARSTARDGMQWRSTAVFTAGADGAIDLSTQAPLCGTWRHADAMGVFWSMEPDPASRNGNRSFFSGAETLDPVVTNVEAVSERGVVGSATIERRYLRPGVRCRDFSEAGVTGFLCNPGDGGRHPGVIVLGGSEGGFSRPEAALLASRGFTALSLAYFAASGRPATLQNIPLEYFGTAIRYLGARPEVDANVIAVYGTSRGAEAALMAGAAFPEVKGVIAQSPPHARWEGVNSMHLPSGPAWTYGGKPLPYIPNHIGVQFAFQYLRDTLAGNPVSTTPLFIQSLTEYRGSADVEIPAERIRGPVLLVSGNDDWVWPSSLMAARVLARLRNSRHAYADGHLSYWSAGHWLPVNYVPLRGSQQKMKWAIGGNPEGTARAQAEVWPKILQFLSSLHD